MRRSPHLEEILRLDPVADHRRIVFLDVCYEFPFDTTRSLELALFRTFAVPSIAKLLDATGEFAERAQKRYDDTDLLLSTILEEGYDSELGKVAIRRMNRIHARFTIANEDFLYVLSTFVLEPFRWNERFGWRPLVDHERVATFETWRQIGRRMGIAGIPETVEELARFNVEYERRNLRFTEAGARVATATRRMFLDWFPGLPRAVGERAISAVLDDRLLEAVGFARPSRLERRAVEGALRLRSRAVRTLPPRRRPRLRTRLEHRSYRGGYRIETLGPPP